MTDKKILTTHVGSLPRPKALLEANIKRAKGEISEAAFNQILEKAIDEVVAKQKKLVLILSMKVNMAILHQGKLTLVPGGTIPFIASVD